MSLAMVAIYVAGVISGVILVSIALAGWIHKSALKIKEKQSGEAPGTYTSASAMADYRADRHKRGTRVTSPVARHSAGG